MEKQENTTFACMALHCVVSHQELSGSLFIVSYSIWSIFLGHIHFTSLELDASVDSLGGVKIVPMVPRRFLARSVRCSELMSLSRTDATLVIASAILFCK